MARPSESLKQRAVRGTILSLTGLGISLLIRLIANAIMTRFLDPGVYGIMAMMITLEVGFKMLSDLGTRISIVNSPRGEEKSFLDTAWTIEVVRGIAMWLGVVLLAWPWSRFYEQPALLTLLPVFSFSLALGGFTSAKLYVLKRKMELGKVMAFDIGEQLIASTSSILWALYVDCSIWALVAGGLIGTLSRVLASYFLLRGPGDRFRWDPEAVATIRSFGSWIFVSTALTFFAQRLDILMMPRLLTIGEVGVYNVASQLAGVPMLLGGRVITAVLLPALAESRRESAATLQTNYVRAMDAVLMAGGVVCLGVALVSPTFFWLIYRVEYHDAQWISPMLTIVAWFSFGQEAATASLQALGKSRPLVVANGIKLVVTAGACFVGYQAALMPGFIIGAAIGALSGHLVLVMVLRQYDLPAGGRDVLWTIVVLVLGLVGVLAPRAFAEKVGVDPALLAIGSLVLVGLPALAYVARHLMREIREKREGT